MGETLTSPPALILLTNSSKRIASGSPARDLKASIREA